MPTIIKNGRNYSGTSVSLTQAEYDALPEITKMNGTTYFITDSEVVLNAEDVALDEGNLNDLAGSVATIETSPATTNHEVGEYILWNGVLYTVTSAIATGENLVINSNISVRTIGSELQALNTGLTTQEIAITLNTSAWNANNTKCYRMGNLVILNFYVQGTPSNSKTIATGCPHPMTGLSTSAGSTPSVVSLDTNGTLYIQSSGTGTYIGACLAYLTND